MFNIVCKMRSQLHLVDVNKDKEISQSHLNQNGTVQNLIVNNLKAETCFTLLLDNPRIADRFCSAVFTLFSLERTLFKLVKYIAIFNRQLYR